MKTRVYIDGFNLYYGLLKGGPHKWLDLERFCDLSFPKNIIEKIYYFTAPVTARPNDPEQPVRQKAYLDALATLARVEVHLGTFMSSVVTMVMADCDPVTGKPVYRNGIAAPKLMPNGKPQMVPVLKSEEKGSDVNLASYLLRDAFGHTCECAIIVSNDSDLLTPIRMAKAAGMVIGLMPPRERGSIDLKRLADFKVSPRQSLLTQSALPAKIVTHDREIIKPAVW